MVRNGISEEYVKRELGGLCERGLLVFPIVLDRVLLLGEAEFDEERTEHSDAYTKGNYQPEIDAFGTNIRKPVDTCSKTYTEQHASEAKVTDINRAGFLSFIWFINKQLGRFRIRIVLNDELTEFFLLLILFYLFEEYHHDYDNR